MHDGSTRKIDRRPPPPNGEAFFTRRQVTLVAVSGDSAGQEFALDAMTVTIGRGTAADLRFDDDSMSREHATFELVEDGFRVRDLGSTNGVRVNGHPTLVCELKHGDKVEIGEQELQYLQEERAHAPTYDLSDCEPDA